MNALEVRKEQFRIMKIYACIILFAFICSSFCFFIGYMNIPLGILLGGLFGLLNHYLLYFFSGEIFSYGRRAKKKAFIYYLIRYFVFGIGLTICLLFDYFNMYIFFWASYLIAYITHNLTMIICMYFTKENVKKDVK